jgi:hypothetical protein
MPTRVAPTCRRFNAIDAAIVLAAVVLGCAGANESVGFVLHSIGMFSAWSYQRDVLGYLLGLVRGSLPAVSALIAPLTIAVLVMRLRHPRPPVAQCFRRYGAAACGLASIVVLLEIINAVLDLPGRLNWSRLNVDFQLWSAPSNSFQARTRYGAIALSLGESPGLSVAGAYLALWATGLGRAERSWIDRSGRVLGWMWVLIALADYTLPIRF